MDSTELAGEIKYRIRMRSDLTDWHTQGLSTNEIFYLGAPREPESPAGGPPGEFIRSSDVCI